MIRRDDATEKQVQAANPKASTWVTANAGSGKTRVLTDRVARLLLSGVEPQRVLCLTYTKAAATEMQNRLFNSLGSWAMMPADKLREALLALGEGPALPDAQLVQARRLFARALETPGGLRLQTIHSFCAALLRRFPLEAGVSPGFSELDDRSAKLLRAQIVEEMAAFRAPDLMAEVARHFTGDDFAGLMEQVANNREGFRVPLGETALREALGLQPDDNPARILQDVLPIDAEAFLGRVRSALDGKGNRETEAAAVLAKLDVHADPEVVLSLLDQAFLTKDMRRNARIPTKAGLAALGEDFAAFDAFLDRHVEAINRRRGLKAAAKTAVLHRFASVFLPLYEEAKAKRGWLDFDDLISRTKALLQDSKVSAWVLYRLDGGIDHILVDEAQDTSPDQWRVIELLAQEFTSGEGAHTNRDRTLFVVGDKKQSIYSFQGADVAAFDAKHLMFAEKFRASHQALVPATLQYSFRSASSILELVDETFAHGFTHAMGDASTHIAFKSELPGRVDLWPLIDPVSTEKDEEWENPVDLVSESHHSAQLARMLASEIREMIDTGTQITTDKGETRPVHEGDFLILVQRRSPLFHEIIRSCKKEGLEVAGADRLKLAGEVAVKDLTALLSFLATPEDDLSLAELLRSPLCGWTEDELFRLAHGRKGFLWEAMRDSAIRPETLEMLRDLRDQADFLRPYDLLERTLTRHDGRRRFVARLGEEAEDGIDAFLQQALSYEQGDVPSLTGFLVWLKTDEVEIKRQMDSAGRRIRVMTVHGAKGLEAPIVILPDTADRPYRDRDEIYSLPDGPLVWKTPANAAPLALQEAQALRRAQWEAENARLLYVALTRPRSWLIVAGAGEAKTETSSGPKAPGSWSWYRLVEKAMKARGASTIGNSDRLRLSNGVWPEPLKNPISEAPDASHLLPDWANLPADPAIRTDAPLSPSNLGGAKALAGESLSGSEEEAKERGTAIHLLLEHLPAHPETNWTSVTARLIPDPTLAAEALAEARSVLTSEALRWIFAETTLAEVPLSAPLGTGRIEGTIDRLLVEPDRVCVVDFKTNSVVPTQASAVPEGVLRQMGAYAAALAQIYPQKRIETAILWTRTAKVMPLDPEIVSAALGRAAIP